MAIQNLNQVQRNFVREVARPMIERLIIALDDLDSYIVSANNQQTPIVNSADILGDEDGVSPRVNAPTLTGTNIAQLLTFVTNMRAQVTTAQLNALVALAVRDVRALKKAQ